MKMADGNRFVNSKHYKNNKKQGFIILTSKTVKLGRVILRLG